MFSTGRGQDCLTGRSGESGSLKLKYTRVRSKNPVERDSSSFILPLSFQLKSTQEECSTILLFYRHPMADARQPHCPQGAGVCACNYREHRSLVTGRGSPYETVQVRRLENSEPTARQ
jgi:hypothetical protein